MSLTSRQRRNHVRSVRHRIEHQQLACQQEARAAWIETPDELERDRQLAWITLDVYVQVPLSPPFYLRHLGLNDVCHGATIQHPSGPLPPVLSTRKTS